MIICVCKAVSDRHIKKAVADGATHVRDLTRNLALGTCCGKCLPDAKLALCNALQVRQAAMQTRENANPFFASPSTEFAT